MKVQVIFEVCAVLNNVTKQTFNKMQKELDKMGSGLDLTIGAVSYYPLDSKDDTDTIEFEEEPFAGKTKKPFVEIDYTQVKSISEVKR